MSDLVNSSPTISSSISSISSTQFQSTSNDVHVYTIGGVRVEFPTKAYPSQIALMDKVIRGLNRAQNCLLESPTGTGKTLALLCSALSWQKHEYDRIVNQTSAIPQPVVKNSSSIDCLTESQVNNGPGPLPETNSLTPSIPPFSNNCEEDEMDEMDRDVFKTLPSKSKRLKVCKNIRKEKNKRSYVIVNQKDAPSPGMSIENFQDDDDDENISQNSEMEDKTRIKLPKIFYGTRTHKQIEHVVQELKKTAYKNVNMTILSSREHTCIHELSYAPNSDKNAICKELLDPRMGLGCKYHTNYSKIGNHQNLEFFNFDTPWNIEDLVKLGKRVKGCPYFGASSLTNTADIVFCPYNYLIDPLIRSARDITLKGNAIILDEAHNIEDICRDVASFSVNQSDLDVAKGECERLSNEPIVDPKMKRSYAYMATFLSQLSLWMHRTKDQIKHSERFEELFCSWTGTEIIVLFEAFNLPPSKFEEFRAEATNVLESEKNVKNAENWKESIVPSLSSESKIVIEGMAYIFQLFFMNNLRFIDDFRIVLKKTVSREKQERRKSNFGRNLEVRWNLSLNFMCQNPSIVLHDIKDQLRTIVVTSGTLCPIDSFKSELGIEFPITLEANHIINKSQIWVSSITNGPSNYNLNASFKNTEMLNFQDELGLIICDICKMIPFGVLCFFTSYSMMNKLIYRWQISGLWASLEQRKVIFQEPRYSKELNDIMKTFYQTIKASEENNLMEGQTGALFLAICRGKVSEGLDFADNNARAVISVGIPYPNIKNIQVGLKMQYNNANLKKKSVLNGNEWYEIQAYRALNQALGRCIRHAHDWGAIILIDDRFSKDSRYTRGLSKWLRNSLNHQYNWNSFCSSLGSFIKMRTISECR